MLWSLLQGNWDEAKRKGMDMNANISDAAHDAARSAKVIAASCSKAAAVESVVGSI